MLKIALVNPPRINKYISSAAPPFNLAVLASYLRLHLKDKIDIKIIDGLAGQKVEENLLSFQPDLVGITSTTPTISEAYRLATWTKENLKNALVLMGGVHVSVLPNEALAYADCVIVGEGEIALLEIAEKLIAHEIITEKIIARPHITNLDDIPSPAWDLIDFEFYIAADDNTSKTIPYTDGGRRAITMISSRGCPYRCIFCHNSWRPTPVRYHSAERVLEEIKFLNEHYQINSFFFADDEFMVNRVRLNKICESLISNGLANKIIWGCQARSDVIERVGVDGIKTIKQAGCNLLAIGFESGSQKMLDILEKNLKLSSHQNAIDICYEAGMKVSGSFMAGVPGENKEDMLETFHFIQKNQDKIDLAGIGIATPYPGTKLWQICVEKNLIDNKIEYADLNPDPRFGLDSDRIFCDQMTKDEFRSLFRYIHSELREANFSRAISKNRYSIKKILKVLTSHPLYILKFIFKQPRKTIQILIGMLKNVFKKISKTK